LGDRAVQVGVQFGLGGLVADLPRRGDEASAGRSDAVDDLPLDVEVTEQPVEPFGDDGDRFLTLDRLDGGQSFGRSASIAPPDTGLMRPVLSRFSSQMSSTTTTRPSASAFRRIARAWTSGECPESSSRWLTRTIPMARFIYCAR
jgi:hypothetical protein